MATEGYLVTKGYTADRAIFINEEDIIKSLEITYSILDHVIDRIGREYYVVRYMREDVINQDVFTVQRVPIYETDTHL